MNARFQFQINHPIFPAHQRACGFAIHRNDRRRPRGERAGHRPRGDRARVNFRTDGQFSIGERDARAGRVHAIHAARGRRLRPAQPVVQLLQNFRRGQRSAVPRGRRGFSLREERGGQQRHPQQQRERRRFIRPDFIHRGNAAPADQPQQGKRQRGGQADAQQIENKIEPARDQQQADGLILRDRSGPGERRVRPLPIRNSRASLNDGVRILLQGLAGGFKALCDHALIHIHGSTGGD